MCIVKFSRLQVDKKTSKKTKIQAFYWNDKKGPKTKSKMEAKRSPKNPYWDN